jgi:hypothetical protein
LASANSRTAQAARPKTRKKGRRAGKSSARVSAWSELLIVVVVFGAVLYAAGLWFQEHYTVSLQSPVRLHFQWPVVVAERVLSGDSAEAQYDQDGRRLSAWQQYACRKFGSDCRVALAIQRAENPQGKCEIYHYNTNGTLDWGYFQINTVHLQRPGLNLRDLLDCKANIDFAYQLYRERGFQPWSTFNSGAYLKFMRR